MQNIVQKGFSIILLSGAFLTSILYIILIGKHVYSPDLTGILLCTLQFSVFLILGIYLLNASEHHVNKQRNLRFMWILLFLFYFIQMVYMLFFSSEFARDYVSISTQSYKEALHMQWIHGTNLIPFNTIQKMIAIFSLPAYSNSIAIINLFGNFIAFMPFAFFLLMLCKKAKKTWRFALFMAMLIICVEVTQFFTLTGSMDIDDFILNFSGVMVAYAILKISFFRKIMDYLNANFSQIPTKE